MVEVMKEVFGIVDYVVFVVMLVISAGIGVYYAIVDRKEGNSQDFLMGGRSLSVFPVSMSVLASFMSAITLLGNPAEVYLYGSQYIMICLSFCLVVPATAYLYLPVFYNLGITSAYEYLEVRFHHSLRTIGSVIFFFHMMMYMPVVLYAPALALAEVTGLSIWFCVLSVGLVCTFYTSIGGMKAVVWTDLFQTIMMYTSIFVILIKGSMDIGGMDVVWEKSWQGDRIEFFNLNVDPTVRYTFWGVLFGGYIMWMGNYAANQAMIQRYLTIKTLGGAQSCLWINLPALIVLIIITSLAGLVIYAFYVTCDPIGTKIIDAPDQLFPRFVMETLGSLPGIPGLFVSGIFSGALSTVSSGVNSLAAVTLEDIIKIFITKNISELWATRVTKFLALLYGLLSISLVFVARELGGVLKAALSAHGIVGGPMLAVFTLGMFFPWVNTWGAAIGLLSGFVISLWFGMGAFTEDLVYPSRHLSYESCPELYFNVTGIDIYNVTSTMTVLNNDVFVPYRLSFLWLSGVGFVVAVTVGLIVSFATGHNKLDSIDERLLSPFVIWAKQYLLGGKQLQVHKDKNKDTSMTTLGTISSIISDGNSFCPTMLTSINPVKD